MEVQYKPIYATFPSLWSCQSCGAVVFEKAIHTRWHTG